MTTDVLPSTSIARLEAALKGKACLVVGAAPLKQLFSVVAGDVVVAVNGGISSCPPGPVDVWVVNSRAGAWEHWGPERLRLASLMLAQASHRHVRLVVFLAREDEAPAITSAQLRKNHTTWDDAIALVQSERHELERLAGARTSAMTPHALSAGMTAAAICFAAGAESVRLAGFSWKAGYQYAPGDRAVDTRGHEAGDKAALPLLDARYGTRFWHPEFVLPAKERSVSTNQPPKPPAASSSPTPQTTKAKPAPGFKVRVKPGKTTWYGNQRYREGAVYMLRSASHFKPKVHERVDPNTKLQRTRASDVGRERQMQLATVISGGKQPRLSHNAADLLDNQGTGEVELTGDNGDAAID